MREMRYNKDKLFKRDLAHYESLVKRRALEALYDDSREDITAQALDLKGNAKAVIVAQEPGVLCGLIEAKYAFLGLKVHTDLEEGAEIKNGQRILGVEGDIAEILKRERTALNFLQLLSGIATETKKITDRVGKYRVAALRKNHPLLTESEKRAVQVGGGLPHRMSLADGYLVKNTHLAFLKKKFNIDGRQAVKLAVAQACKHRKHTHLHYFVEVEARDAAEAVAAAKTQADAILIDNQVPKKFREIAMQIRKVNTTVQIEASGGITPQNAKKYLDAGASFVSMSYLVMRSKPLNMHLKLLL
ncbi:MAG: hypothetical protein V1835_06405 [Candidatus Micrarchaeota archaeon]